MLYIFSAVANVDAEHVFVYSSLRVWQKEVDRLFWYKAPEHRVLI